LNYFKIRPTVELIRNIFDPQLKSVFPDLVKGNRLKSKEKSIMVNIFQSLVCCTFLLLTVYGQKNSWKDNLHQKENDDKDPQVTVLVMVYIYGSP
jgi:hypothetical protein